MEKQEKKTSKIKAWWEKNKGKIADGAVKFSYYAGGFILGGVVMQRFTRAQDAMVMEYCHDLGIIKLFDPVDGVEIGVEKLIEVTDKVCGK